MSEQSDTPRVDAVKFNVNDAQNILAVPLEFARQLARELSLANERLDAETERATVAVTNHFNACEQIADLEKALSTALARIAELERELDCNLQQMQTKF